MGKETKIGLAVIAVLLSIFGTLLFRHLSSGQSIPEWDHEERAAAEPLVPDVTGDKTNVVMAQHDGSPGGAHGSLWGPPPGRGSSQGAADVPAESYMPAEAERDGASAPPDRYASRSQNVEVDGGPAAQPDGTSPFQNRGLGANEATSDVEPAAARDAPAELPREQSPDSRHRNPLRRLSAELPLPEADETSGDEAGAELPIQGDDPYAVEEAPAGEAPAWPDDAAGAEPTPAQEDSTSPAVGQPPNDEPESAGDDYSHAPVQDEGGRQPVAGALPSAPVQDDWSSDGVAGSAGGNVGPLPVEDGMYTVQPNDTLWSISSKVYGTGGYFKALAAHNRADLPRSDQLTVGMKIAVPPADELEENYPSLCPKERKSALVAPRAMPATATKPSAGGNVYMVEEGDTLFDIARYELGNATRWAEIYELNREQLGEDVDYLRPGIELRMPAAARRASTISRGGDARYLR